MNKNLLFKIALIIALLFQFVNKASAQYASGTSADVTGKGADPNLVGGIYWLQWDGGVNPLGNNPTLIAAPGGFDGSEIKNGTYTWQYSATMRITAQVSNITVTPGDKLRAYTPGEWGGIETGGIQTTGGDNINYLFNGTGADWPAGDYNNAPQRPRGVTGSAIANFKGDIVGGSVNSFDIAITVELQDATGGGYHSIPYPGMVMADAESMANTEYISGRTNVPTSWQLIALRQGVLPTGKTLSNQEHYVVDFSDPNGDGDASAFKIYTNDGSGDYNISAVMYAHNATGIKDATLKGQGITAISIGFVMPFDKGDAPTTTNSTIAKYKQAAAYIDDFSRLGAININVTGQSLLALRDLNPNTGTAGLVKLTPTSKIYLGNNNVDADGDADDAAKLTSDYISAKTDNKITDATGATIQDDEESIANLTPANVVVNTANGITLTISKVVNSNTTLAANVWAWLDFNRDGKFTKNEIATASIPSVAANTANSGPITLTWANADFKDRILAGKSILRVRVTSQNIAAPSDNTTEDERSIAFTDDGEVEDYEVTFTGVNISGTVKNDPDGGTVSGSALYQLDGSTPLFAYLVNNTSTFVEQKALVNNPAGTYSFTNIERGDYNLVISTKNITIVANTQTLADITPSLPSTWVSSSETLGSNNASGVEAGAKNSQINVVISGASNSGNNVTGVDFGINQVPTATADAATAVDIGVTPIDLVANGNDIDPDGTIDATTILIEDPASPGYGTSKTIVGKGVFTVLTLGNAGKVRFVPESTFTGTVQINYTIKDNGGAISNVSTLTYKITPLGANDPETTNINTPVTTSVLGNDTHGTGDKVIAATIVTPGNGGAVSIVDAVAGTVKYTPSAIFTGTDTYTYKIESADGTTESSTVLVVVKITPVGVADPVTTTIGQDVTTNVLTNDIAAGTGAKVITPALVTPGNGGAVSIVDASVGTIKYTPAAGFTGTDTYTYKIESADGTLQSANILVTVKVSPVGVPNPVTTSMNTNVVTNVRTNDLQAGTGAKVTDVTTPTNGGSIIATDPVAGTVEYRPATGFAGIDTYTYRLTSADNTLKSPTILVTVTVTPTGQPDADNTAINTPVTTNVVTGTGADAPGTNPGGPTTVTDIVTTANGTAVNTPGDPNSITYTPATGFIGVETYTYKLTTVDGLKSNPITVTITVKPVGVNDNDLTPINTPVTTIVTTNDGVSGNTPVLVNRVTAPAHGTVNTGTGTSITYTPANGYVGTDTYTYTLTKGGATSAPVTVTINVYTATMSLSKMANNNVNKVGDVISYSLILTNTGTATLTNVVVADPGATIAAPTTFATLAPGEVKTLTATYTVVAADVTAGFHSNQATVTGKDPKNNTVTKVSDDPVTTSTPDDPTVVPIINNGNPSIGIAKVGVVAGNNITYTFTVTNTGNVNLNNITITDAKLGLNAVVMTIPGGGWLAPAGTLSYTAPQYTLTQADKDAGTVNNTATATGKDPGNNTVTGTGSTVTTVTKSPVAVDDHTEATTGALALITILTNDDAKGSTFQVNTIEIIAQPVHGTVAVDAVGTVTYTSNPGFTGDDVFTYRVKDANGYYTNIANVTVKILPEIIKIPTLFTPNGDGVNDGFVIKDLASYAQNELIVLNRWGNEVYRMPNYQNSWSGTGLNEGTYFYIVKLKKANGDSWVIQKGYVTLIRQFKK